MAPFTLFSVLSLPLLAQALSPSLPTQTSTSPATSALISAPSPTTTRVVSRSTAHDATHSIVRYTCPGVVTGLDRTSDNDISHAYCCVGGVFSPSEQVITKWFYNHTGTSIPSTVITPTTCVQPVPLTASDYELQIAFATATVVPVGQGQAPLASEIEQHVQTVDVDIDTGAIASISSSASPIPASVVDSSMAEKTAPEFTYVGAAAAMTQVKLFYAVVLAVAWLLC